MLSLNPKYILKNHVLQEAIERAEVGEFDMIDDLVQVDGKKPDVLIIKKDVAILLGEAIARYAQKCDGKRINYVQDMTIPFCFYGVSIETY